MAARSTTASKTTAKATKTTAKATKRNYNPAPIKSVTSSDVKAEAFPTVTRTSTALAIYDDDVNAMVKNGTMKRFPAGTAKIDETEAKTLGNRMRQRARILHKHALTVVFVPAEGKVYMKDGGPIKARQA